MTSDHISRKQEIKDRIDSLDCPTEDPLDTEGVILSDEIKFYCDKFSLIKPLNDEHLEPASYDLSVGKYYSVGDKGVKCLEDAPSDFIKIDPFEVAIIQTEEFVNLPRFLIGRWNILVGLAYEGLLWVGGPQVDPGYSGYLYCPIYNLSSDPVHLRRGAELASIDFIKTTEFLEGADERYAKYGRPTDYESKKYERPPSRLVIEDYDPEELRSALVERALDDIEDAQQTANSIQRNFRYAGTVGITATIVLFTALSIIVSSADASVEALDIWSILAATGSALAVLVSIGTLSYVLYKFKTADKG